MWKISVLRYNDILSTKPEKGQKLEKELDFDDPNPNLNLNLNLFR